jgi:hypothetical protein
MGLLVGSLVSLAVATLVAAGILLYGRKYKDRQGAVQYDEFAKSTEVVVFVALCGIGYFIALAVTMWEFESSSTAARKATNAAAAFASYAAEEIHRRPMPTTDYLTNYYICTANMAGLLFTDSKVEGIVRTVYRDDAVRLTLLGGARAFVFDCWSDVGHQPVIQSVEPGSQWRRTSFNQVSLATPLKTLMTQAFESNYQSTSNDLIIIYLRFRTKDGKTPNPALLNATATVLQSTIQPYRLDAAYNRCRGQDQIVLQPINTFARKVIVVCNFNGAGTMLADYINIASTSGIPVERETGWASTLPPASRDTMKLQIQQNLTFVAPFSNDPAAQSNTWDIAGAERMGVHCLGLYMDPTKLTPELARVFAKDSFVRKDLNRKDTFVGTSDNPLIYRPQHLADPMMPPAKFAQMGAGPTPGAIKSAPAMVLPGM